MRGVISITIDYKHKRAVLRTKPELKPEVRDVGDDAALRLRVPKHTSIAYTCVHVRLGGKRRLFRRCNMYPAPKNV